MKEWSQCRIGEVVSLQQGLCINSKSKHMLAEQGYALLRITDLINDSEVQYICPEKVASKFVTSQKDIIYTRTGQVGLVFKDRLGVLHNNCFKVIPNEKLTIKNSKPHTYAFCSDTRYDAELVSKIKKVDLLYHETTFKKDLEERAHQTGHSTTLQAATIARKAEVKNLLIGHYSQRYKDFEELSEETKEIFNKVLISYSGLEIDFKKLN